jgi:hypothetical protein
MSHLHRLQLSADDEGSQIRIRANLLLEDGPQSDGAIPIRFVSAGQSMPLRGFRNGIRFTAAALRQAVDDGHFTGAAVFFTHVLDSSTRDVRDLAGVTANATFNEETQAVEGVVIPYSNGAGQELTSLASDFRRHRESGIDRPDVGVSLDAFFILDKSSSPPRTERMAELLSVDIVFKPAAEGRILAQDPGPGGSPPMELEQDRIVEILAASGLPQPAQDRLAAASYETEEQLQEAIAQAQAEAETPSADTDGNGEPAGEQPDPQAQPVAAGQAAPGSHSPAHPLTPTPAQAQPWLQALRQEAVNARLATSELPQPVQQRLAAGDYSSPQDLDRAIAGARDELAALAEDGIINIGGQAPRAGLATNGGRAHIHGMATGLEAFEGAVDWLFGVSESQTPDPFLRDIKQLYLALTGDYEFRGTFNADRVHLTGATTTTLADIAANAMNKVIIQQFSVLTHWRWYERVTLPTPNDGSVQDMQWSALGGISNLPTVPEKGAYGELDMSDVKETDSFTKYGGYVPITLELIRNSDIQRMQAVPRALALAAVRTRSKQVSDIFTSNFGVGPTLGQDSKALFHADHNNLATTAFGTNASAWRAARTEMFEQTEINSGKALGLFPRYWLGPADLYDQALEIFGYGEGMPTTYTPEAQSRGFADPRPVPLAVPDFTDDNDWAYIADPQVFPVIHISYAQAPGGGMHPAPELFTVTSPTAGLMFTNDVLPIKVRDWFAVGVNGYRGIGKRNVA